MIALTTIVAADDPIPYRLTDKGWATGAAVRQMWLRDENCRQKAAYRASVVSADETLDDAWSNRAIRAHRWANRPAAHDLLALRMSFAESAARAVYGAVRGAWWRQLGKASDGHCSVTDTIDVYVAQTHRQDISGVLKSELVWAHKAALIEQRKQLGSPIGERSNLP